MKKNKEQLGYKDGLIYEIKEMREVSRRIKHGLIWQGLWEQVVWFGLLLIVVLMFLISIR